MNLGSYLKDRCFSLAVGLFCGAAIGSMVYLLGSGMEAALFAASVVVGCLAVSVAFDYLRRRRFYTELAELAESLSQRSETFYIAELLDPPHFYEGEIAYETLQFAGRSMHDEVMRHRTQVDEYREYIETWIHEIKTPIAAVRLLSSNMRGADAARFGLELDRIESYVEQALYYARSTAIDRDYSIREVALAATVRDAVKKNASFLIARGVSVAVDIEEGSKVFADKKWLLFVLGQILVNAAKYDSTAIRVSAAEEGAGSTDGRTVLTVADDGCGIPASDIDSVFDKGFTGENGRAYGASTGIGLYLCARMCEGMGLGLGIASEAGKGTRVMVAFPSDRRRLDVAGRVG